MNHSSVSSDPLTPEIWRSWLILLPVLVVLSCRVRSESTVMEATQAESSAGTTSLRYGNTKWTRNPNAISLPVGWLTFTARLSVFFACRFRKWWTRSCEKDTHTGRRKLLMRTITITTSACSFTVMNSGCKNTQRHTEDFLLSTDTAGVEPHLFPSGFLSLYFFS